MMFALRINILAKGFSGISTETLQHIVEIFNHSCIPEIPSQGTVGASGDLAPLAHLAAGLMGVGRMWSQKTGWADAKQVLEQNGLKPVEYRPKEVSVFDFCSPFGMRHHFIGSFHQGLTMINGTQFITALGAEGRISKNKYLTFIFDSSHWYFLGVERAILLARQADVIAALSTEALRGTVRSLHPGKLSSMIDLKKTFSFLIKIRHSHLSTSCWTKYCCTKITILPFVETLSIRNFSESR